MGNVIGTREMEEAKEAFRQIIKMAILFGGVAIFYVWIESKLLKKWKNKGPKGSSVYFVKIF